MYRSSSSDQSVPMFHDDVYSLNSPSHGLYRPPVQNYSRFRAVYVFGSSAEGGICLMMEGQQPMQYCSSFDGGIRHLIKLFFYYLVGQQSLSQAWIECGNKALLALLPTASIDKAFLVIGMQFSIGKMIKRRHNSITVCPIDRTDYHFRNRWV